MKKRKGKAGEHEQLVQRVAHLLARRRHSEIRAALGGYERPEAIEGLKGGRQPDVTSVAPDGKLMLVSVETTHTLERGNLVAEWTLFADYSAKTNSVFCVAALRSCELAGTQVSGKRLVQKRLQDMGLSQSDVSIILVD